MESKGVGQPEKGKRTGGNKERRKGERKLGGALGER